MPGREKRLEMPCPVPPVGSTVRFAGRGCLAPPAPAKGRRKPGTWGRSGKAVLAACRCLRKGLEATAWLRRKTRIFPYLPFSHLP